MRKHAVISHSAMARNRCLVLFLLLFLSGCTTRNNLFGLSDQEISQQAPATQAPPAPAAEKRTKPVLTQEQIQPDIRNSTPPREPFNNIESSQITSPVRKSPSQEEIRRVQVILKTSGIDPGPVDGVLGPRTRVALQTFQSRCATLNDFLERSDEQVSHHAVDPQAPPLIGLENRNFSREQIRLTQRRLRDCGVDPGPVDGILGPKTRAALQHFSSRYGTLSGLLGTLAEQITQQAAETHSLPTSAPEKQVQPVLSKSSTSSSPEEPIVENFSEAPTLVDKNLNRERVRLIQIRLKAAGFDPGPIDGILGPRTRAALEQQSWASNEY